MLLPPNAVGAIKLKWLVQKVIHKNILFVFCILSQLLPGHPAAFTKRGWRNDAHMALRDCNAARELDAYSVPAHQRTSEALLQLKRYKQALQFAERAHQLDPANPGLAELVVLTAGKVREGRFQRFMGDLYLRSRQRFCLLSPFEQDCRRKLRVSQAVFCYASLLLFPAFSLRIQEQGIAGATSRSR
jgi:tetratricopeptide (TPR) repeat protein